jgi:hypothetical protein
MPSFIRQCQVTAGSLSWTGGTREQTQRIRFQIFQRGVSHTPGSAEIIITNPARTTMNEAVALAENTTVTVDAGYEDGNFGQIFTGQLVRVSTGKENPADTFIKIQAYDMQAAHNFGVVNKRLPANCTGMDYLNALVQSLSPFGVQLQTAPTQALQQLKYPRGLTLFGPTRDYLRQLSRSVNCTWCFQRGQIQMLSLNGTVGGTFQVSSQTGMVSIPIQTLNGVMVRTLLNPEMNANNIIQLNPQDITTGAVTNISPSQDQFFNTGRTALDPNGMYRIIDLAFSGDTRAPAPWFNDITCVSLANGSGIFDDSVDDPPATIQTGANTVNIMRDG